MAQKFSKGFCYVCQEPAIDVDHVPAKCFFPVGYRINLITVPACQKHNQAASEDDEFVRNCLVISCYNEISSLLKDKLNKSFQIERKISDLVMSVVAKTDNDYIVETDNTRLTKCFVKIVRGIYFHEYKVPLHHKLTIVFSSHLYIDEEQKKIAESSNSAIKMLDIGGYFKGENQDVFKYSLQNLKNTEDSMLYMVFYKAFNVSCVLSKI